MTWNLKISTRIANYFSLNYIIEVMLIKYILTSLFFTSELMILIVSSMIGRAASSISQNVYWKLQLWHIFTFTAVSRTSPIATRWWIISSAVIGSASKTSNTVGISITIPSSNIAWTRTCAATPVYSWNTITLFGWGRSSGYHRWCYFKEMSQNFI